MMLGVDKRFWFFLKRKHGGLNLTKIVSFGLMPPKNNLKDVINIGGYGNRYKNNRDNDFIFCKVWIS